MLHLSRRTSAVDIVLGGITTVGNGSSRLRAPLERGRRVQTAMFFFILFDYKILSRFVALIYFVMNEKILSVDCMIVINIPHRGNQLNKKVAILHSNIILKYTTRS